MIQHIQRSISHGFALIGAGLLLVIVAVTALNMLLAFLSKELLERKLNVT